MPLSEEELRLLEQMERALVEEDPKFASTLRGTTLRRSARRRAILAGVVFVLGIVVLMTGAITGGSAGIPIGIVGFVIMLASATVSLTAIRGQAVAAAEPHQTGHPSGFSVIDGGRSGRTKRQKRVSHGTFMERVEERWRRRRDQNGGGY